MQRPAVDLSSLYWGCVYFVLWDKIPHWDLELKDYTKLTKPQAPVILLFLSPTAETTPSFAHGVEGLGFSQSVLTVISCDSKWEDI